MGWARSPVGSGEKGENMVATKINVFDLMTEKKKEMDPYSVDFVCDYSGASGYICDLFYEFADGRTSIYYSDIIRFISENVEAVNDAITELGWDGCGSDLYKAGQTAEYLQIENTLQNDFENIVQLAALEMIVAAYGDNFEMEADAMEALGSVLELIDTSDRFDQVDAEVRQFMSEYFNDEEDL